MYCPQSNVKMQEGSRCSSTPSCFQASPLNLVQLRFCYFDPLYFPYFRCMIRLYDTSYKGEWILCERQQTYKEDDEGGWWGNLVLCLSEVRLFPRIWCSKQTLPLCIFLQCKLHLSWTQGRSSTVLGLAGRCGEWMWKKYSASCSQWQWLRFSCPHGTPSFSVVVMVFCCGW